MFCYTLLLQLGDCLSIIHNVDAKSGETFTAFSRKSEPRVLLRDRHTARRKVRRKNGKKLSPLSIPDGKLVTIIEIMTYAMAAGSGGRIGPWRDEKMHSLTILIRSE
jgi:hypothetical protein